MAFLDMVRPDSGAVRRVFLVTSARFVSFGAVTGTRLRLQATTPILHLSNVTHGQCKFAPKLYSNHGVQTGPPYSPQCAPFVP